MHLSFISEILKTYWTMGQSLSLSRLVDSVINPPFDKLGERSVEEFFSKKDRAEFNSRVNLLLVDPVIKSWFIGQEIDFDQWFAKGPKTPVNVIDLRGIATETKAGLRRVSLREAVSLDAKAGGCSGSEIHTLFR
jgi:hypothetical protein